MKKTSGPLIRILIGIAFSLIFIYLSLVEADLPLVASMLSGKNPWVLLPAIGLSVLVLAVRVFRWGLILSPLCTIPFKDLLAIAGVGFFSIVLIPARIGELVRPYLLHASGHLRFASSLATVFLERVMDMLSILMVFIVMVIISPLPDWAITSGKAAAGFLALLISFVVLLYFKGPLVIKTAGLLLQPFPALFRDKVLHILEEFIEGFEAIASGWRLLGIVLLSLLVWFCSGLLIHTVLLFFSIELGIFAAFLVLVINIIGISIPTAPGMLGNFQYACIVALSIYGVPKEEALAFSVVYYLTGIGIITLLGLWGLTRINVSPVKALKELGGILRKEKTEGERSG
jgi:uncharacterized protein (TIRG00374 family)